MVETGNATTFVDRIKEAIQMVQDDYGRMCAQAYVYETKKYAYSGVVDRFVNLLEEIGGGYCYRVIWVYILSNIIEYIKSSTATPYERCEVAA